jgi:SAM-dependent methyltransferase
VIQSHAGSRWRNSREQTIATATTAQKPIEARSVETSLTALLDHLGITRAHFAGRGSADVKDFASIHAERIASLTLLCPAVLDTATLAPLAERLLVVTGDHGPGPRRVQARLADLPQASVVMLNDYAGHTWADIAAERGDSIGAAMQQFLTRHDTLPVCLPEQEGEIAGISFSVRGPGPPLVLLPLDLSPGQWEPLIPALSARYCTITLGGALLGSVASLEERGRSGYISVVRALLDTLEIVPGESVLEVGCGSGVIMRELARRTAGANRLIGRDMSPFLLREARALARREGLLDHIDFGEGRAEALPLADGVVDVALSSTVFEEGAADLMLSEIVRVMRPGGRIGIIVRAIDMGQPAARSSAKGQGRRPRHHRRRDEPAWCCRCEPLPSPPCARVDRIEVFPATRLGGAGIRAYRALPTTDPRGSDPG